MNCRVMNYGAIGTILGHELTHGFDNSGRQFDTNGNLKQWWSNETIGEYVDKTQCFIDQYDDCYEDEVYRCYVGIADNYKRASSFQIDEYIDGEMTLGENIADNGGFKEAYMAYDSWRIRHGEELLLPGFTHLTHEQLFFLGYAHVRTVHGPSSFWEIHRQRFSDMVSSVHVVVVEMDVDGFPFTESRQTSRGTEKFTGIQRSLEVSRGIEHES